MLANRRTSGFVKANHWLSGDQTKSRISKASDWAARVTCFDSTSTNWRRLSLSVQAMRWESGDQTISYL